MQTPSSEDASRPAIHLLPTEVRLVSGDLATAPHVEPHLSAHPTDPEVLLGTAITVAPTPNGDFRSDAFISTDAGRSWRRQQLNGCGTDPWTAIGPAGALYVSCHDSRTQDNQRLTGVSVHRSLDGGTTWLLPSAVPLASGGSVDQPKMAVDLSNGPRRGWVYIAVGQWVKLPAGGQTYGTVVARSNDRGATFSEPVLVHHDRLHQQPFGLGVVSDGAVVVSFMDYADNVGRLLHRRRSWTATSSDGARSFSLPALLWESRAQELTWAFSARATSAAQPQLHALLDAHWQRNGSGPQETSSSAPQLAPLSLLLSNDHGLRWQGPNPISDGPATSDAQTPAVAIDQRGVIGVAWYDTRHSSRDTGLCFDIYFAASTDGGSSFGENLRITPATSCPQNHAASRGIAQRWQFGGDYSGLAAGADGVFHLLWADTRRDVYQLWSAKVRVHQ